MGCRLLGDLDVDAIERSRPIMGPLIYATFVTSVLSVAFTILIAIIANSYEAVKEDRPKQGMFPL